MRKDFVVNLLNRRIGLSLNLSHQLQRYLGPPFESRQYSFQMNLFRMAQHLSMPLRFHLFQKNVLTEELTIFRSLFFQKILRLSTFDFYYVVERSEARRV